MFFYISFKIEFITQISREKMKHEQFQEERNK